MLSDSERRFIVERRGPGKRGPPRGGRAGERAGERKKKWVIEVDSKVVLVAKSSLDTRFQLKVELFQVGAV